MSVKRGTFNPADLILSVGPFYNRRCAGCLSSVTYEPDDPRAMQHDRKCERCGDWLLVVNSSKVSN